MPIRYRLLPIVTDWYQLLFCTILYHRLTISYRISYWNTIEPEDSSLLSPLLTLSEVSGAGIIGVLLSVELLFWANTELWLSSIVISMTVDSSRTAVSTPNLTCCISTIFLFKRHYLVTNLISVNSDLSYIFSITNQAESAAAICSCAWG